MNAFRVSANLCVLLVLPCVIADNAWGIAVSKLTPAGKHAAPAPQVEELEVVDLETTYTVEDFSFFKADRLAEAFLKGRHLSWGAPQTIVYYRHRGVITRYAFYYRTTPDEESRMGRKGIMVYNDNRVQFVRERIY